MTNTYLTHDSLENNELSSEKLTDRILFAVREGNELKAKEAALQLVENGVPGFLENELLEWQFYLVRILTLLVAAVTQPPTVTVYIEKRAQDGLRAIAAAKSEGECRDLMLRIVDHACMLNRELGRSYSMLVQRVMEQVALDLTKPLTLQYFSEILNVNSSYLSNLFRQQTGATITEYVTNKRIQHAATLLAYSNQPIKQIARQVGIADVQYFSRLFKRRMKMTPSEYRMQSFERQNREIADKAR